MSWRQADCSRSRVGAAYSFPQEENYRRAAALVDQVLKGRKPADIEVPAAALLRAHKVIPA